MCQASCSQSFNFPCSTRCFNFVQADAISLELQQIAEQIRMLEEFEVYLAEELGISAEDIDSVRIFFEVKNKAFQDADYSLSLGGSANYITSTFNIVMLSVIFQSIWKSVHLL